MIRIPRLLVVTTFMGLSLSICHAQDTEIAPIVKHLKEKISTVSWPSNTKLLDSLKRHNKELSTSAYDAIVNETIDYAFDIDSFALGLRYADRHVIYLEQVLGQPDRAIEFFSSIEKKLPQVEVLDQRSLRRFSQLTISLGDVYYFGGTDKSIHSYP